MNRNLRTPVTAVAAAICVMASSHASATGEWQSLSAAPAFTTASIAPTNSSGDATDGLPGTGWNLVSKADVAPGANVPAPSASPKSVASAEAKPDSGATIEDKVIATPVPVAPTFDLVAGQSLESQLLEWAKRAGWAVVWNATDDFIVPGGSSYGTDFVVATQTVFDDAAKNGADFRLDIYKGNRSIVVDQSGASE
ncbi:toxin co-regulated pilus biosynthesis Q family protein [Paraburkholderia sp. SIMBA_054]|uniref:toxin co-regulated pilus biosynthesis Q family protein n=1 Tax=Paraburkholderia sp. SIMBA_054 TaxID=3085795 RepID=UPI00397CFC6A